MIKKPLRHPRLPGDIGDAHLVIAIALQHHQGSRLELRARTGTPGAAGLALVKLAYPFGLLFGSGFTNGMQK